MIYFFLILILLAIGLYWYIHNNVLLPAETNSLIAEIQAEGIPELIPGKVDFALNGEVKICFEVNGEAKKGTIIMINGHGQTMLGYPHHFFMPLVEAGYQVIRMDNRGVGDSSWMLEWGKPDKYTLEDMATDVIAVLDHLGKDQVHLIGFSMGGMIAQRLAISYSERFLSLTCMMTTGYYYDPELTGLPKRFYWNFVLVTLLYGLDLSTLEKKVKLSLAIGRLLEGSGAKVNNKEVLQLAFYDYAKRNGYQKATRDQHGYAITKSGSRYEELGQIKCPTLVIHGTDDPLVLFENAPKYAPMIPNVKTYFIEGMGHHFPREHTPEMVEQILQLLNKTKKENILS